MNQKILKIIFAIIGTILFVLSIIMLYFYMHYYEGKDPLDIRDKIESYMENHNLKQGDYNFEGVFWLDQITIIFIFPAIILFIVMNGSYLALGILGFICYIVGLFIEKLFPFTVSSSSFCVQILFGIIDIIVAFSYKTLTSKDLSDFGELNSLIRQNYDLYLQSKLYMKLTSFYLFFCPIFFVITSILQLLKIKKNTNAEQPLMQPNMQEGIQPIYQNNNLNENYPSNVPQEDNLYNEPNNGINVNNSNNI